MSTYVCLIYYYHYIWPLKFVTGIKPKLRDINKIVGPHVEKKWYEIGLELEIGDEEGVFLDEIKKEHAGSDQECFLEIMKVWVRSKSTSVSWTTLRDCLKELKLQEAVEVLESKSK